MDRLLDFITKSLWDKNYPRTLIIFNINNLSEALAGILVFIFSFVFPTEGNLGYFASALIVVVPISGSLTALFNRDEYEKVVIFTHLINAFVVIPLYFCTMGTVYGLGLFMFMLAVIQSFVLVRIFALEILVLTVQNTLYGFLISFAFYKPELFINYETLKIHNPLFYIGAVAASIYISFLARVFVYVFKLDYENTIQLAKNVEEVNSMDDLTGAYNEKTGLELLQALMNNAWKSRDALSVVYVDVDPCLDGDDDNKYMEDLVVVNAFDACRDTISANGVVARVNNKRFLLILPDCKGVEQIESIMSDINSQFSLLKQVAKIENGTLSFGCANLLRGMSINDFLSLAEKDLLARRTTK